MGKIKLTATVLALGVVAPSFAYFLAMVLQHQEWHDEPGYSAGFNSMYGAALLSAPISIGIFEPAALVIFVFSAVITVLLSKRNFSAGAVFGFSLALPALRLVIDLILRRQQSIEFDLISSGLFGLLVGLTCIWLSRRRFAKPTQSR